MLLLLKVKLEHTKEYRVIRRVDDIKELRTKVKAAFKLGTDDFDVLYTDNSGDLIMVSRLQDICDGFSQPETTESAEKCSIRVKNKKSSLPKESSTSPQPIIPSKTASKPTPTSKSVNATVSPSPLLSANNLPNTSVKMKQDSTAPQQPQHTRTTVPSTPIDYPTVLVDMNHRLENILQKNTEHISRITQLMEQQQQLQKEQQQQQQQQQKERRQHESIGTSSHPTATILHSDNHSNTSASSVSCSERKEPPSGCQLACNQCPDRHTYTLCQHQRNIPLVPVYCRPSIAATCPCQEKLSKMDDLKKKKHSGVKHSNVVCDQCHSDIVGIRYKCGHCPNFDLCETCEPLLVHNQNHVLLKIRRPLLPLVNLNTNLLPSFDYSYKPTDCKTHQKPQANAEHECSPVNNTDDNDSTANDRFIPEPKAGLMATFMDHTNISDGHVVEYSRSFMKLWRLKNAGTIPWPPGSVLRYIGGDVQPTKLRYQDDMKLSKVLLPGEEMNVSIYLRAPESLGKHVGCFRMVTPQGTPFGDLLWCHITVSAAAQSSLVTDTGSKSTETIDDLSSRDASSANCMSDTSSLISTDTSSSVNGTTHQTKDDRSDTPPGPQNRHFPRSRCNKKSTMKVKTSTMKHDHQVPASSPHADFVFVKNDSTDRLTSSQSSSSSLHFDPPTEKSPTNNAQTDITDWFKVSKEQEQTTEQFAYAQQLAQLREMGYINDDEEAKKLLIAHDGNLNVVWFKLMESCYPTL